MAAWQQLVAAEGYIEFEAPAGETVEVFYPSSERVAHYQVGAPERSLPCTGYWRGETLLPPARPELPQRAGVDSISPPSTLRLGALRRWRHPPGGF